MKISVLHHVKEKTMSSTRKYVTFYISICGEYPIRKRIKSDRIMEVIHNIKSNWYIVYTERRRKSILFFVEKL